LVGDLPGRHGCDRYAGEIAARAHHEIIPRDM